MKNAWKIVLFLVGLVLIASATHEIFSLFSIYSNFSELFSGNDTDDHFALLQLNNLWQMGILHMGLGLLLIHQAVKFHLGYKK